MVKGIFIRFEINLDHYKCNISIFLRSKLVERRLETQVSTSWPHCSFSALISEFHAPNIFLVYFRPADPYQGLNKCQAQIYFDWWLRIQTKKVYFCPYKKWEKFTKSYFAEMQFAIFTVWTNCEEKNTVIYGITFAPCAGFSEFSKVSKHSLWASVKKAFQSARVQGLS